MTKPTNDQPEPKKKGVGFPITLDIPPPQEPTNDLREIIDILTEFFDIAYSQHEADMDTEPHNNKVYGDAARTIETLLARRQNELIGEILGQLPKAKMPIGKMVSLYRAESFVAGHNQALSEVMALLNKIRSK